jgi:hypothetical protein
VGLVSEQYTKVPLAQAVFTKVVAVKTASAHAVFFTLNLMLFFPFKGDRKLAANLFCEKARQGWPQYFITILNFY